MGRTTQGAPCLSQLRQPVTPPPPNSRVFFANGSLDFLFLIPRPPLGSPRAQPLPPLPTRNPNQGASTALKKIKKQSGGALVGRARARGGRGVLVSQKNARFGGALGAWTQSGSDACVAWWRLDKRGERGGGQAGRGGRRHPPRFVQPRHTLAQTAPPFFHALQCTNGVRPWQSPGARARHPLGRAPPPLLFFLGRPHPPLSQEET